MFKILVVEDNSDKLREIISALSSIQEINEEEIDHEIDSLGAKRRLENTAYDLMVLDIAIPPTKGSEVDLEGGLHLVSEINSRPRKYSIPRHIIGLTGKEEIVEKADKELKDNLISLIQYRNTDLEWRNLLLSGVKQWISAENSHSAVEPDYDYDVAIVCALSAELKANCDNGWSWNRKDIRYDDTNYFEAELELDDSGVRKRVVAAHAERMGMPAATALASKLIGHFRPKYIIMTGIMAGVSGRVNLGDLVVLNPIWDWGSGKWVPDESTELGNSLFLIDPYQFHVEGHILKHVRRFSDDDDYLYQLRKSYGNGAPINDIKLLNGPAASGASVLSHKEVFDQIKEQHRKLLGVEMEAYGLFSAVESAPYPKPKAVCVKAVVDFGDAEKDDDFQDFGMYASAHFAKDLIESLLREVQG